MAMYGAFVLIPNFSTYFQYNLGFPRENLGTLYLAGGVVSFGIVRVAGIWVDKLSATHVSVAGTLLFAAMLALQFVVAVAIPAWVFFVCFMTASSVRNVSLTSASSRVPAPQERARFMSAQSAMQHLAASLGAFTGTLLLSEASDHQLVGMNQLATVSIALALTMPFMLHHIERLSAQ